MVVGVAEDDDVCDAVFGGVRDADAVTDADAVLVGV